MIALLGKLIAVLALLLPLWLFFYAVLGFGTGRWALAFAAAVTFLRIGQVSERPGGW